MMKPTATDQELHSTVPVRDCQTSDGYFSFTSAPNSDISSYESDLKEKIENPKKSTTSQSGSEVSPPTDFTMSTQGEHIKPKKKKKRLKKKKKSVKLNTVQVPIGPSSKKNYTR